MAFDQIRLDRALSRLELAMLVVVISLCAAALLHRLAYLEAMAEARALDLTIRSIRTGIMVNVATRLLQGESQAIVSLAGANPVGTVIEAPAGYIGVLREVNPEFIQPGQWYFNEDDRTLVYHVINTDYVEGAGKKSVRMRLNLKLNYDDRNDNDAYDPGIDSPSGVSLNILDFVNWTL